MPAGEASLRALRARQRRQLFRHQHLESILGLDKAPESAYQ